MNIPVQIQTLNNNYDKVIDTKFKTFTKNEQNLDDSITIEQLFKYYDNMFYQIPKDGSTNSHNYILNKTIEYLNVRLADDEMIQALLDEITNLKQVLLEDAKLLK